MTTDTSERSLERLICTALAGHPCEPPAGDATREARAEYGGVGWLGGSWLDYDREYCVDLVQLTAFLHATQPEVAEPLSLAEDGPVRRRFLARLQGEITKRGTIDVLRHGIRHGAHELVLFHGTPSPGNIQAQERFEQTRFTVARQLRYSRDETQRALDIGLFINGLPVFTFELKNNLTKQTVDDAVWQDRKDRNPREKLFEFGRCIAHFAVDENEVRFCTELKGKASWFLPFNRGWNDGTGNPPNPDGLRTYYLWREVLARKGLTDIIENYAQVVETKDDKTGRRKKTQIWPRYHQIDAVRRLLADAATRGVGKRYLVQHSAGSGKSNSIAWLAHRLIGLSKDDVLIFDSIIVVTDRRILDKQIRDTIRQYAQTRSTVGHAERSGDLRRFIETGRKIIISTVQKFPFILDEIGNEQRGWSFAIIIDEAHSSRGGRTAAAMSQALSETGTEGEDETFEDRINRAMESRKLLPNASYFAFTATPKNKTLEIFGDPDPQPDGTVKHRAFHTYTMKQAIQEGFILDVLGHYTPVRSFYKLAKTVEEDPEFDKKKAQKKLKHDVFVLDFLNDADTIRDAFADFYRATILADETDPNRLHDLQADLDDAQVYSADQIDEFARSYLGGAERDCLDPVLDACVALYKSDLDEDGQVAFKGRARAFARTYAFLSAMLPYGNDAWEKRSIFLEFLIPKLPAPEEEDPSKGILDAIDMDSYRVEKQAMQEIALADADAEIDPVPASGASGRPEAELDRLSNIITTFNDLFGDVTWEDRDRVGRLITETIPARVASDTAFRNARVNSDRENARIEHDRALLRVMTAVMKDDTELFRQFMDNESFKRWMTDTVFTLAYEQAEAPEAATAADS